MKITLILCLAFFAFFSSCNIFTLTGASTELNGNFYDNGYEENIITQVNFAPIVTSASVSSIFTGGAGNCGNGVTVQLYGAHFTTSTVFTLFDVSTNTSYTMTLNSLIDDTEASVTIGEALPIGASYGVQATNEFGSSKAFAFSAGCA